MVGKFGVMLSFDDFIFYFLGVIFFGFGIVFLVRKECLKFLIKKFFKIVRFIEC